jgi:membrane dipeptidase
VQTEELVHGGLTAFGREVVAECNCLGVVVDCAHATFETTLRVLEESNQPIMISHSHLDHPERHRQRLLSNGHAQAGVTGTSLDDFADDVARLADLVGVDHVAIGTDMDASRPSCRSGLPAASGG